VMALERENAIAGLREVMGATNPEIAAEGTIRKRFATSIERNCIHGSDAAETAASSWASSLERRNCCRGRAISIKLEPAVQAERLYLKAATAFRLAAHALFRSQSYLGAQFGGSVVA